MSACRPARRASEVGGRRRVEQDEPVDALRRAPHHLEGDVAAEREADQREAMGRRREQRVGHGADRVVRAEDEDVAVVALVERVDLRGEEALVAQVCAGEDQARSSAHAQNISLGGHRLMAGT
jgi:hypothetical protein